MRIELLHLEPTVRAVGISQLDSTVLGKVGRSRIFGVEVSDLDMQRHGV